MLAAFLVQLYLEKHCQESSKSCFAHSQAGESNVGADVGTLRAAGVGFSSAGTGRHLSSLTSSRTVLGSFVPTPRPRPTRSTAGCKTAPRLRQGLLLVARDENSQEDL